MTASHSDDLGNLNLRDSRRTQILLLQVGVSQGRRVWAAAAGREPPDAAAASPSCSGNIEEYWGILEMACNIDGILTHIELEKHSFEG